nr:recombinase family protein [uncultured Albidiferax sp.]
MTQTAYSYSRFSSPQQQHGRSQARQIEGCQRYCDQHGLHLADGEDYRFLDAGVSGWKGDHLGEKGDLTRFINLVKEGTIKSGSVLIVESLDRLSREQVDKALSVFLQLLGESIDIVTLTDQKIYRKGCDFVDLITSIVIMSRAHEESSTKSRRVRDAYAKKHELARTENRPMGQNMPMWLELSADKKEYILLPERTAIVQRIYQLAIDGYGRAASSRILNKEGIPSFKGKTWATSSLDKVLNNRAVLGEYQPYSVQVESSGIRQKSGEPILGYFPTVITESIFYQAQAAISGRRISVATKQSKNFNVWQGVAKCSVCGSAMHMVNKGKPPRGYVYLQCYHYRKGLCANKGTRLDSLEPVFRHMLSVLDSKSLIHDDSAKITAEITVIDARIAEQKDLLEKYRAIFKTIPSESIAEQIASTEKEITTLENQSEALQSALASEAVMSKKDFLEKLDLVSYEGRNRANTLLKKLGITAYINKRYTTVFQKGVNEFEMEVLKGIITLSTTLDKVVLQRYAQFDSLGHAFTANTAAMIVEMEQGFPVLLDQADEELPTVIPDPEFWRGILAEHEAGIGPRKPIDTNL